MPRIDASRIAKGRKAVNSCAYKCSRNTLAAINTIFVFLGLILIGIAAYGKKQALLVSIPALGGVIACGVFLLLIAILGLVGALRHNQVILFFYMIIMSLLFILLLAFSVAVLAITTDQQKQLLKEAWKVEKEQSKVIEERFSCCGFDDTLKDDHCPDDKPTCYKKLSPMLEKALSVSGGVGLFFSFTLNKFVDVFHEFLGLILIGIAAYGKKQALLVSIPALGGVIACGVFLLLIAILGLVGALRHNQVILFFYMIIMSLLFILLLAFSVAVLAITTDQQKQLLKEAWKVEKEQSKVIEERFSCCGFDDTLKDDHCPDDKPTCYKKLSPMLEKALSVSGGVGLFFSFTLNKFVDVFHEKTWLTNLPHM